jgi:uncharacterized membrane protein
LLHAWLPVGNDPLTLRLPSLVFAAATASLWAILLRRQGLPLVAALALLVWFFWHPMFRFQAANVRMYSLLLLETTGVFWALVALAPERGRRQLDLALVLGLLLALAIYTSYFALFFAAGVALTGLAAVVWPGPPQRRRTGWLILAACALSGVLLLPWAPSLWRVLHEEQSYSNMTPAVRMQFYKELMPGLAGTTTGLVLLGVGWIGALACRQTRRLWGWALAAMVATPSAIGVLMSINKDAGLPPRYLIFAMPVMTAAGAMGWMALLRRARLPQWAVGGAVAAVLLAGAWLGDAEARRTFLAPMPDWWGAAAILKANARAQEIILTGGYLSGEGLVYHLDNPKNYSFLHYVTKFDAFRKCCADPRIVWYVNIAPLPDVFRRVMEENFPYRLSFPGGRGMAMILVAAKKPFTVPWEGNRTVEKLGQPAGR